LQIPHCCLALAIARPASIKVTDFRLFVRSVPLVFACLSGREALVVALRYGFGDTRPKTFEETGRWLGTTRRQAAIIEARAFRRFAEMLAVRCLRGVVLS